MKEVEQLLERRDLSPKELIGLATFLDGVELGHAERTGYLLRIAARLEPYALKGACLRLIVPLEPAEAQALAEAA